MLDALLSADIWLFYAINNGMSSPLLDAVMSTVTNVRYWYPIYAAGISALLLVGWQRRRVGGKELLICALLLVAVVAVLDPLSNHLIKEVIGRPRPFVALVGVHQLVGSGGGSFPSNHAMNNSAVAVILSAYMPRWTWAWGSIAVLIGFSRVYCGVHYPSDVAGGMVMGVSAGIMLVVIARKWRRISHSEPHPQ